MTNRKFKPKNFARNRAMHAIISQTYEMQCEIILRAREQFPHTIYPKTAARYFDEIADWVEQSKEWERDGTFEYRIDRLVDDYHINRDMVHRYVKDRVRDCNYTPDILQVMYNNVVASLAVLAANHGIGKYRMERLQTAMTSRYSGKPSQDVANLHIAVTDFSVSDCDCEAMFKQSRAPKCRESLQDINRAIEGLQAYKNWYEKNVEKG